MQKIPNEIQDLEISLKVLGAEIIFQNESASFGGNLQHMIDFYKMVYLQIPEVYGFKNTTHRNALILKTHENFSDAL